MSHFIQKCECGKVISQCRCIGDKYVHVVRPCRHYFVAHSVTSFEPITMESLYKVHREFLEQEPIPNVFRCHPSVYHEMREYFYRKEAEEEAMGITKPLTPYLPHQDWKRIMGVEILIDRDLKPGEWKFERIVRT